jgi:arsenite methyltransferase
METNDKRELVQKAYGDVAKRQSSCCTPTSCCSDKKDYTGPVAEAELGLSCGDPVAFSHLKEGDVVVDLGSGAGRDVFLAAQIVGTNGRVIGVDMTPDMIALAQKNAEKFRQKTGLSNVEFRQGFIESLPVIDNSVDVVISNCVINLSPDKPQVFREIFRVLKKGGRMVVSDIVLDRPLPEGSKDNEQLYAACIAGALLRADYRKAVCDAGFATIELLSDKTYKESVDCTDPITGGIGADLAACAASITVMAVK